MLETEPKTLYTKSRKFVVELAIWATSLGAIFAFVYAAIPFVEYIVASVFLVALAAIQFLLVKRRDLAIQFSFPLLHISIMACVLPLVLLSRVSLISLMAEDGDSSRYVSRILMMTVLFAPSVISQMIFLIAQDFGISAEKLKEMREAMRSGGAENS